MGSDLAVARPQGLVELVSASVAVYRPPGDAGVVAGNGVAAAHRHGGGDRSVLATKATRRVGDFVGSPLRPSGAGFRSSVVSLAETAMAVLAPSWDGRGGTHPDLTHNATSTDSASPAALPGRCRPCSAGFDAEHP
ncbi:hypothetical protein BST45_18380 [Mycobacterium shinjukuense]|nr:hypothetical protein BST45_18380 [Mycobacterium shinjukuense]